MHSILAKHHDDVVLFVGHNGINKAIIAVIIGGGPGTIVSIEDQPNTGICMFDIDKDKNMRILVFNSIDHLS